MLSEGIPQRIDMDVKAFAFLNWRCITPHVVFVRRRVGSFSVASSMGIARGNAKAARDFIKVWDISENAKRRTVVEIIHFIWFLAAQETSQCAKHFVVAFIAHAYL